MAEEITIKKSDVWKYATFVLIAVVVIGGFFVLRNKGSNNGNVDNTATGPVDLSGFLSNSDLYPSLGPSDSKNVVIEFADFQCPWCGLMAGLADWASPSTTDTTVQSMISRTGDLVGSAKKMEDAAEKGDFRFIYVPMSFLGQGSIYASEAAYCANEQGKFWEMHDAIFTNQVPPSQEGAQFTKDQLESIASKISGLDKTKFKNCLENDKYLSAVQLAGNQARSAAPGTPKVYVNGQDVNPAWSQVQAALN